MGVYAGIHIANVDPDGLYVTLVILLAAASWLNIAYPDDSAAHISEETANAARAAPLAILVSVAFTSIMGWLLLISISFAIPSSVGDILLSKLPLPLGQVFVNVLGKNGMLAIWSMIIVVQVSDTFTLFKHHIYPTLAST
jgi:amino acid transporter